MHWDSFRSCIYTPTEYARDRKDFCWTSGGREISYSKIYAYFSERSWEQQEIFRTDQDTIDMCASLPRFNNLRSIHLCFTDGIAPPFRWLSTRAVLDGQISFPSHLEKMATAMIVARENKVPIHAFRISGFYPRIASEEPLMWELMTEALANVEELQVIDSPTMVEYLAQIPLPRLRRFELASCWLSVTNLEAFVYAHADTLRFLHLDDIWFLREERSVEGIHLSVGSTKSILDSIIGIRTSGILWELTMNRQPGGYYEIRETFGKVRES